MKSQVRQTLTVLGAARVAMDNLEKELQYANLSSPQDVITPSQKLVYNTLQDPDTNRVYIQDLVSTGSSPVMVL